MQPPSGGCVLKPQSDRGMMKKAEAAAFGRLCVETPRLPKVSNNATNKAAAFGRLCVETSTVGVFSTLNNAAAFGRLCVETSIWWQGWAWQKAAAFGRLCVET